MCVQCRNLSYIYAWRKFIIRQNSTSMSVTWIPICQIWSPHWNRKGDCLSLFIARSYRLLVCCIRWWVTAQIRLSHPSGHAGWHQKPLTARPIWATAETSHTPLTVRWMHDAILTPAFYMHQWGINVSPAKLRLLSCSCCFSVSLLRTSGVPVCCILLLPPSSSPLHLLPWQNLFLCSVISLPQSLCVPSFLPASPPSRPSGCGDMCVAICSLSALLSPRGLPITLFPPLVLLGPSV